MSFFCFLQAVCLRSGITVALKVYFLHKVPSNVLHMILREINIHHRLVHRHIIMLYGAFQDPKHIVLVQEYAARGDLFGIHKQLNSRMPEHQAVELVLAPFISCLAYLHSQRICHRDIKPGALLCTVHGYTDNGVCEGVCVWVGGGMPVCVCARPLWYVKLQHAFRPVRCHHGTASVSWSSQGRMCHVTA